MYLALWPDAVFPYRSRLLFMFNQCHLTSLKQMCFSNRLFTFGPDAEIITHKTVAINQMTALQIHHLTLMLMAH